MKGYAAKLQAVGFWPLAVGFWLLAFGSEFLTNL
jgi:hypothetical protein